MDTVWQDLRYGARLLLRQPGFAAIAVLTLALGIGANSAIFSVVNAVLLRPLPYGEPDRLVNLYEAKVDGFTGSVSVPNLEDWRARNEVLTEIAAYESRNASIRTGEYPERVEAAAVSADIFEVLGVAPGLGRAFLAGEDGPAADRVVILSDRLWRRTFAADPGVVGSTIHLDGGTATVVGVMPPDFYFPSRTTELWTPLVVPADLATSRGSHYYQTIARLRPGVTLDQAQEQMSAIARAIEREYPDTQTGRGVLLTPRHEVVVSGVKPALLILLAAVGFVLLIACTNVANLLLARGAGRRREVAVRSALGAGGSRLIRQFLTESVLLSALGGLAGLALARAGVVGLSAWAAGFLGRSGEFTLDGRVVAFTAALSFATGVGFGLLPALQASRADIQGALKEGGGRGGTSARGWLRSSLVAGEIAAALVLLVGAGLLLKSFARLQATESGMKVDNVLTAKVSLFGARYEKPEASVALYRQVLDRLSTLPGVESAGLINILPVQRWGYNGGVQIEGREPFPPGQAPVIEYRTVSDGYFRTMGVPVVAGRNVGPEDTPDSLPVLLVNETFARSYLADRDPLGRRVQAGDDTWYTVVGVVGDVRQSGLAQPPRPEIYFPYTQDALGSISNVTLVVKSALAPGSLAPAVRDEVAAVDPTLPVFDVRTMDEVIGASLSDRRVNMLLMLAFALVAALLATIGVYSVMSYVVTQGTREIGIRIALGARPGDVLRLVVGQGLVLALFGIAVGAAAALALTRLMSSLLYGVEAGDPATYAEVSTLLLAVALAACYVPARRATKVDPIVALRYE